MPGGMRLSCVKVSYLSKACNVCVYVCVCSQGKASLFRQHGGSESWWGICLTAGGEFRSFSIMPSVSSELCRDRDN